MFIKIGLSREKTDEILEEGMECISRVARDRPQWKKAKTRNYYEAECDVSEDIIIPVFNELIAKYPKLHIYATYSEDIREDDSSAQWWGTTVIKTEHHPEKTTLRIDSSTYWF